MRNSAVDSCGCLEHVEVKIMPDQYQMARQHVKHVMQFGIELQMFWWQ